MIHFLSLNDVTALHGAEINEAVSRVVNEGWSLQGKENERFEENYSKFIGTKYTIGCANGLDARTKSILTPVLYNMISSNCMGLLEQQYRKEETKKEEEKQQTEE